MSQHCDDCATHIGPLAQAIKRFGPRVLEIGSGWYSTPLIHGFTDQAMTLENDSNFFNPLSLVIPTGFYLVNNLVEAARGLSIKHNFDVVFVDCYLGEDRVACAKIFLDSGSCIVGHDTERSYWQPILSIAKFQKHFRHQIPNTSWFSNTLDVLKT